MAGENHSFTTACTQLADMENTIQIRLRPSIDVILLNSVNKNKLQTSQVVYVDTR